MPPLLADFTHARVCKPFCEKFLTLPTTARALQKIYSVHSKQTQTACKAKQAAPKGRLFGWNVAAPAKKRAAGPAKRSSFLFSKIYRWLSHHLLCLSLIFEPAASQGRLPAAIPPGRPAQTQCHPSFYYGLEIFFKSS